MNKKTKRCFVNSFAQLLGRYEAIKHDLKSKLSELSSKESDCVIKSLAAGFIDVCLDDLRQGAIHFGDCNINSKGEFQE